MSDPRKYLVNITTRTVHNTKSKKIECQPRKSDNIGYADSSENLTEFVFCSCTSK